MSTEKPKNDFQLLVNYSNHCVWKKLRNGSGAGAGADAASGVDVALSPTEPPLSEIVWSPNRGFSLNCLNCVDSSFSDKNTSLYKDVRPSSMVLAVLQSVTGGSSNSDMPIDDVWVNPITVVCANSGISSADTPPRHPSDQSGVVIPDCKAHKEYDAGTGGYMEKIDAGSGVPKLPYDQKENLMNYCEKNFCVPANVGTAINKSSTTSGQVDKRPVDNFLLQADEPKPNMGQNPSPRKLSNGGMDIGSANQVVVTEDGLCTNVEHIIEYEGSGALTSSCRSLIEKLESAAEDDIQNFNCEATYAATNVALVSMSNVDRNKSEGNAMTQLCDKDLPALNSPSNRRIHKAINKSKEKSLLDGNANASLSKEENRNHLSVESCYSARLFLTGKKRSNSQQRLIIGSKRIKKQTQESSYSTSKVKGDSSFMNLISNMMRGFSQSNPDHHLLWPDQKLITCNENQDPELKNSRFNPSFKSISCPSLKNLGAIKSHRVEEASEDFELDNKVHGIDVAPINFCAENNSFYKHYLQSDEFEASTRVYDAAGPSLKPKIRPINFLNSHENRKNNSVVDKNNNDNVESCAQYERKVTDNIFHRSGSPGGLWMARFLPKSITFDLLNEIGGNQVHSSCCSAHSHSHKQLSYLNNCKIEGAKEQFADDHLLSEAKMLQNCCINKEASTGLKDSKGNNDHTSKHKFNPITPFQGLRDLEPMASMFARRLGAIKHIPTERADSIPHR